MTRTPKLTFDGRVAVITGAGGSLGQAYACLLADRGARILVNDIAQTDGGDPDAAAAIVADIEGKGGTAVRNADSVLAGARIIEAAMDHYGRVDIVINNAGHLLDRAFQKMTRREWDEVLAVHLRGAYEVTHAVWPHMRASGYGRIVMTSSAVGLYGNFGQANYASAKAALLGLCKSLALEGRSRNILCNAIAPVAASRLTQTVMSEQQLAGVKPDLVAPLVAWLSHEKCGTSGALFEAGAGWFARVAWQRNQGCVFSETDCTVENLAMAWDELMSMENATTVETIADTTARISEILGFDFSASSARRDAVSDT